MHSMQLDLENKCNIHEYDNQIPSTLFMYCNIKLHSFNGLRPNMILCGFNLITHNIMDKIHCIPMYKVRRDGCGPKRTIVLEFGRIKSLHESLKFLLQPTNAPFYSYTVVGMHLVVSGKCTLIHIQRHLHICYVSPL